MRKHEAIDIMKLYTLGSANGWNDFLSKCYKTNNINALAKVKYQISVGMDDLAKQKLNTDDMNNWFARCVRSLEITAKRIIKKVNPMPFDGISKIQMDNISASDKAKMIAAKRKRDEALKEFLRKSSY